MVKLTILDYGVGNLFSLKTALEKKGAKVKIRNEVPLKDEVDGMILPGVGSFQVAAKKLTLSRKRIEALLEAGIPVLGVCLGMQLFFDRSVEGTGKGLALIGGDVLRLPSSVKVPHMGWNTIRIARENEFVDGVENNSWVYFVHSYYPNPLDNSVKVADTEYGVSFPSIVAKDNLYGTQFHPEKSSKTGTRIIENFISICRRGS